MPETPSPTDAADILRAAAFHLGMAARIAGAGNLSNPGYEGYRDRMAATGAAVAGTRAMSEVWSWTPEEKAALYAIGVLRAATLEAGPLAIEDIERAVGGVTALLASVTAALEGVDHA